LVVQYYIDVSGKRHDKVMAAGGYIGSPAQWGAFSERWAAFLEQAGAPGLGVPPFHATDFFNCKRAFKHLNKGDDRHTLLASLFALTAFTHPATGFGFGIDLRTFDRDMEREYRKIKTPHGRMTPKWLSSLTSA
jgi:hypothetical protein